MSVPTAGLLASKSYYEGSHGKSGPNNELFGHTGRMNVFSVEDDGNYKKSPPTALQIRVARSDCCVPNMRLL